MFPQDDVMLPGRVRLQHEASLLRTNAVGSPPPRFAVIFLPLPPSSSSLFVTVSPTICAVPPLKK